MPGYQNIIGQELEEVRRFKDFAEKMEVHQSQFEGNWNRYVCHQPSVEFNTSSDLHFLCDERTSSSVGQEGPSDSLSGIKIHPEQATMKTCSSHSYVMDARIRLDSLKAGCKLQPFCSVNGMLNDCNTQKDFVKKEESEAQQSALDLVELLDVEQDVKNEESWLYESPKKKEFEEKNESALTWCRHVLDNPSPEVEAACRQLIHRLDDRSGSHSYRRPAVFQHITDATVGLFLDKNSDSKTQYASDSLDIKNLSISEDLKTKSYRLHDITDVRTMARLQEASLRQDFASTPATASPKRDHESAGMFHSGSHSDTSFESTDDFTPGSKTVVSSTCCQSGLSAQSSSACQSPTPEAEQGCQSPRLARLQQQVTQFKLLKRAQNQATSADRTRSPLRTSLRSLQAVRNSRSLDINDSDCQPADPMAPPPSGAPPVTKGSSLWPPSLPGASTSRPGDITARIKKLQRSQSASPCRIPHSAKGYLSFRGRVFPSPDRSATLAWGRNVPSTRR